MPDTATSCRWLLAVLAVLHGVVNLQSMLRRAYWQVKLAGTIQAKRTDLSTAAAVLLYKPNG
jgi:hypothetical protein